MSEEKELSKKASLLKEVFSYLPVFHFAKISVFESKIDHSLKFKLTKETSEHKTSTRFCTNPTKFNEARKDLIAHLGAKNNIVDTDKVFFLKNSTYPRTTFNRYSDKAKRIEIIGKADKLIGNIDTIFPENSNYTSGYVFKGDLYFTKEQPDFIDEFMELFNKSNTLIVGEDSLKIKQALYQYNNVQPWYKGNYKREIFTYLYKIFLTQFPEATDTYKDIYFSKLTDSDSFDLLTEDNIDKLIDDSVVTQYIDDFKPVIDDQYYRSLLSLLKGDESQVTMGLKLVENLNLMKSKPYLYALFLLSNYSPDYRVNSIIKQNKVFTSIGIKNMVSEFGLKNFFAGNRYETGPNQLFSNLDGLYNQANKMALTADELKLVVKLVKEEIGAGIHTILPRKIWNIFIKNEDVKL